MKKLYYLILSLCCLATSAQAQKMTEENATLAEKYNLSYYANFHAQTVNGEPLTWTQSETLSDITVNGTQLFPITDCPGWYVQDRDNGKNIRVRTDRGPYLFNYGSGNRAVSYTGLHAGQIVVVEGFANGSWEYNGAVNTDNCVDISDSIHAIQNLVDTNNDGEANEADNFYYYQVVEDGRIDLNLNRACYWYGFQVWTDKTADETVTAPVISLSRVDGSARHISIVPGVASYGSPVSTWYSYDGEFPVYREVTETIENTIQLTKVDENGDTITYDSIYYTYKYKPVKIDGNWGDWEYGEGEEYFEVSTADDEDGDGIIKVQAVSITEDGTMSDVNVFNVAVGDIILNAPSLTLVGLDGTRRDYQIGWTNNTLCGEDFIITVSNGEGEEYSGLAIGDVVSSSESITATVTVDGYTDGITSITVAMPDTVFTRKNADVAAAGAHDWDFVNLSEEVQKQLMGQVYDYAYVVDTLTNDTTKWSAEQIASGEYDIPDNAEYVSKKFGWTYDGSRGRATLDVKVDTTWTSETEYTTNAYYAPGDLTETITANGFSLDCPPNSKNNSCILIYTNPTSDLGLYCMSKATFSITGLTYGEYVVAQFGFGGSNYINTVWNTATQVTSEVFTHDVAAGRFIKYIDVYTSSTLPEAPDAIHAVKSDRVMLNNVYSIDGRIVRRGTTSLDGLTRGLYIINGKKYLVK